MTPELKILILAGKQVEEKLLEELAMGRDVRTARYGMVSRGVRQLESVQADVVLLVPDTGDDSWERSINRIREEYGTWSILVGTGEPEVAERAMEAGAYNVFSRNCMVGDCLTRCLIDLHRYLALEADLKRERALLAWVEKMARLGSWTADAEGTAHWSEGVQRIFEDVGRLTDDFSSVRQYLHPADLDVFDQANRATFKEGWPLDFEYRIMTSSNEMRYLHLHRDVERDENGKISRVFGVCHDVTPEREFENFLFRRDAILQVVGYLAEQFLSNVDWQSGLTDTLASLGKAAEVSRTFLFQATGESLDDIRFTMTHEWHREGMESLVNTPMTTSQSYSPIFDRWKRILNERKIVAGNVRDFQSEERNYYDQFGTKSILLVPVFVGDTWWGFLGLTETRQEREWMPGEIESMKMVTNMLGAAILRAQIESQLKDANRKAEDARLEALEASQSKSRFLANMSHEIRTPISGILGMAEMTITTGLTSEQREHMDMIREAARSLLSIINDILDISKIEASKMELKTENFDLRKLMDTTVRHFSHEVGKKPLDLNHTVARNVPALLHGDPDRLGQILRNLIGNAVKFTEHGHIDVNVETAQRKDDRIRLLFTVEDSGEGIAADMIDTVFDSFTQADSSVRKEYQGTGLGLTISRELVRMMGGDISVQSRRGIGSTFTFTIWLTVPRQSRHEGPPPEAFMPKGMHLNILMAEDNPLNQKFLTHFLTLFGHTVTVAENGLKALEILKRSGDRIDLVLMDIQMPKMGGMEATQAIRNSDGRLFDPAIPIIALTAYAMKGDKQRMFDAGMDDYVSKPVDMKELSSAITRAVSQRPGKRAAKGSAMPSSKKAKADPLVPKVSLDMDSLIERFDGNMELLGEILDLFLTEAHDKLARLDLALEDGNAEELGAAIHSITNISSHVLAMDIVQTARELERRCYREPVEDVAPAVMMLKPQFKALIAAVREKAESL